MRGKRITLILCGLLVGCGSAFADTNLFNNDTWIVDGATDPSATARGIAVSVNGVPAGAFSQLKLYRAFTGAGSPQIFAINGSGAIQPSLPPPGVFGGTFYLTGYSDCVNGLVSNLFITALNLVAKPGSTLTFTGQVSNLTSMQAPDFQLKFKNQTFNSVSVQVSYTLYATRDFCVDQSRQNLSQGFPIAQMTANYIDGSTNQNDLLRYITVTGQHCDCCYCYDVTGSVCGSLAYPNDMLVCYRDNLRDPRLWLAHQSPYPSNTPTLIIRFKNPSPRNVRPQGFNTATTDPTVQNVSLWGNWRQARNSYLAGKRVGKFRFTLEANPPQYYNCSAGACYY